VDELSYLMTWPADEDRLRQRVLRSKATLKIVLKTKDEIEFLDDWLRWHIAICGTENIIVFDHGSTLPKIAEIYRAYPGLILCRYEGHLDGIHHKGSFQSLYQALEASALYYAFIDTDEFVTLAVNSSTHDKDKLTDFLRENSHIDVFPGISLNNRLGSRERVYLTSQNGQLGAPGLLWGKPFVKSGTDLGTDSWLHSCWIKKIDHTKFKNNIIVLHLNQFYFERQKRVALSKFISKGRIPSGTTAEQILADDNIALDKSEETRRLLSEFRKFVNSDAGDWAIKDEPLYGGIAEFSETGSILHPSQEQADEFQRLLDDDTIFPRVAKQSASR